MKISTLNMLCFCFFGFGYFSQLCAFKAVKSNKFRSFAHGVNRLKQKEKKGLNQRNKNRQKEDCKKATKVVLLQKFIPE